AKGPDTVALVFYAGHGIQVDGENFLIPTDVDPKREADIPMQAVRLNDVLNTLTSVPSKMRFLLLDSCRNNPFPELSKSTGNGLAIVDAKVGAPGTFLSFSTSPGAVAEDGNGANSPYTTALLEAGKQANIPIEETFKRVRVAVNKAVLINTASGYREFLALYPDSDLTLTARKLAERLRFRPEFVAAIPAPVQNASLNTCPCGPQPAPQLQPTQKKVDVTPAKKVDNDPPPKRASKPKKPVRDTDDEV